MVPDQTFHLSTEPPRPIAAVWTPAVIQDCCPEQITLLCKNPLSVNLCQNEALLTCHMILKSKSVPQKGGKIMSEPKKKKTNKFYKLKFVNSEDVMLNIMSASYFVGVFS